MARKPKLAPASDGYGHTYTVRIPLWPYLVTPLCVLAALPVTIVVHRLYGRGPGAGWTGFALALGAVALVAFVTWASRPRGRVMQVMATGNTVLAMAWIVPAVLDGPLSKGMLGAWFMGGLLMSVIVAVYRIMRMARGDDGQGVIRGELVELGDAVKQLRDVRFARTSISGVKASTSLTMPPGRSFSEVEGAKREVASLLDVPATAIRTVANPDSERRGELHVVPVDQLRDPIPDPGPSAPGGSIALPIVLGRAEDGTDAAIVLPGDPAAHRNAVGVMGVVGMSGSGKTELLLRLCEEVATRCDTRLNIADARKGGQLPAWLRRAAAKVATGYDAAEDMIEDLPTLVQQRAKILGERGYKQWEEGCGLDFEVVVIFEASAVIAKSGTVVDLAESVRSVGICLILELQRATYDRLPTSARSNITTWVVLGVQGEDDAEAALSEATIVAGAQPWRWKNARPGYFYLEWAGRDEARWSEPCRSFIQPDADRAAIVAKVLGWADAETQPGEQPAPAPEEPSTDGGEESAGIERNDAYDRDEPPDDVDESQPLSVPPGMPRIQLGDGFPPMAPADARGLLLQHITDLAAVGHDVVRPSQLGGVLGETGLSGSWLYGELRALTTGEHPVLRKTDRGVYRILAPAPT